MNVAAVQRHSHAPAAFDGIAERYDEIFTRTLIGRAQRNVVWDALTKAFSPADRILELNCGTGEDALFLARRGASITACDVSPQMIAVAQRRKLVEAPNANLQFQVLSNENLHQLHPSDRFDGAFSNFSGLNCVADLQQVAFTLGKLIRSNGRFLLCVSTRFCLWESLWFLAHANTQKAFRRFPGKTSAIVEDSTFEVRYPTVRQLRKIFAPWFRLRAIRAVGLFVPPSYVEPTLRGRGKFIWLLAKVDSLFAHFPLLRCTGDHVLLDFERLQP
jgi:ubiquinone/menaquinone biosynthesis C-methylase UbiE